jgi:hypothetical protein
MPRLKYFVDHFALANSFRLSRRDLLYLMSVTGFIVTGSDKFWTKAATKMRSEGQIKRSRPSGLADSSAATDNSATAGNAVGFVARAPTFPLAVRPGKRYLEDAAGKPFLIQGDAAWSLIAQLRRDDVELYLNDRRARGFNAILVELIEHRYSTNPPANAYGQLPFLTSGNYSTPNEEYFAHADWVLHRAADKGFLVLLTPSYTGFGGGASGWYQEMKANGPARLQEYGRYLGQRYRDFNNIIWVEGGDYNPPDKNLVRAIADGIRELAPQTLHTAHCAPDTSAIEYWGGEHWLGLNSIYTYGAVFSAAVKEYARGEGWLWRLLGHEQRLWRFFGREPPPPRMPFFLIESAYENEHDATSQRLRTQAYHAVLSGAAGQVFGNNPIWHFDGPGPFPIRVTWRDALGSRGAQSMTHLRNLLEGFSWWLLEPDMDNTFLTDGFGAGYDRAVAARAADRSLAIVYLPTARPIKLDLEQLAGPRVAARWYDPADGVVSEVTGSPFPAAGSKSFEPKTGGDGFGDWVNADGFGDWVLVLEATS